MISLPLLSKLPAIRDDVQTSGEQLSIQGGEWVGVISHRYMTSSDFKTLEGNMSDDGKEKEAR